MSFKGKIEYSFTLKNNIEKINITTNLEEFFKQKPPCSDCLVQSICVLEHNLTMYKYIFLHISVCDKLRKFVECNKLFFNEEEY